MYRKHAKEDKQNLVNVSNLIRSFTRVGVEMLNTTMKSKIINRKELSPFLLFRQILEMSDALSVLIRSGCINASKPVVRSLLEAYFQLAYMFNGDEERKSLQFLFHYEKRQKEYYENLAFPKKGGSFFEKLKNDKHLKGTHLPQNQKIIYADNVKKIEAVLNEDEYKEISKEYTRTESNKANFKRGKKGKVSFWYELYNGPTSIEIVSVEMKEAALYEFIYRNCSSYAHIEDIVHVNLELHDDSSFKVSQLRDLRQLSIVTNNILLLVELSCFLFLKNKIVNKRKFAIKFAPLSEKRRNISQK